MGDGSVGHGGAILLRAVGEKLDELMHVLEAGGGSFMDITVSFKLSEATVIEELNSHG